MDATDRSVVLICSWKTLVRQTENKRFLATLSALYRKSFLIFRTSPRNFILMEQLQVKITPNLFYLYKRKCIFNNFNSLNHILSDLLKLSTQSNRLPYNTYFIRDWIVSYEEPIFQETDTHCMFRGSCLLKFL